MTSVKDVRVDAAATRDAPGRGRFVFSDDYSVFDWGRMPDRLPEKGAVLCTMGAFNFERLEAEGVPTHYRGVLAEADSGERASGDEPPAADPVPLDAVERAPREMAIDLVQVPDLPHTTSAGYDYDAYHAGAGENYLVPLEVVFRNTVPVGSSLRSRGTPGEYGLDLDEWPAEPVALPEPVVEFSTKYEEQDRYLDRTEADAIAGDADVDALEALALDVNRVVTEQAEQTGFDHQDGKIECAFLDGDLVVADVAGTFDENRFSYDGQQVSKEVVRQFYKAYDPDWVAAVNDAKAEADARGIADWRTLVDTAPKPLPDHVLDACADLYTAGANAYTGDDWFDAPGIADAVDAVRDL